MEFYERVIEEFGGYEKCKEILKQPNIDFIMNAQALRGHLLDYRRKHNIYEVEDKVVYIDDYIGHELMTINSIEHDHFCLENNRIKCVFNLVKHASPEEIEAGRKLYKTN